MSLLRKCDSSACVVGQQAPDSGPRREDPSQGRPTPANRTWKYAMGPAALVHLSWVLELRSDVKVKLGQLC